MRLATNLQFLLGKVRLGRKAGPSMKDNAGCYLDSCEGLFFVNLKLRRYGSPDFLKFYISNLYYLVESIQWLLKSGLLPSTRGPYAL